MAKQKLSCNHWQFFIISPWWWKSLLGWTGQPVTGDASYLVACKKTWDMLSATRYKWLTLDRTNAHGIYCGTSYLILALVLSCGRNQVMGVELSQNSNVSSGGEVLVSNWFIPAWSVCESQSAVTILTAAMYPSHLKYTPKNRSVFFFLDLWKCVMCMIFMTESNQIIK